MKNKLVIKAIISNTENIESKIQKVLDSFLGCLIIHSTTTELKNGNILTILIIKKQDI